MSKDVGPHSCTKPIDASLLATALDEIACGIVILDADGHVLHSNLAGQLHLNRGKHLSANTKGLLSCTQDKDTLPLRNAVRNALAGKRSMLNLGNDQPCSVAVVPLDRRAEQQAQVSEARVALIFSRSGMCESLMMSFFSRAYQLTHTEEQVLSLLCVGYTAPEMAKELRVGEATVRTHLRSICQKTNSHGIREVTKRLALLPPLMAAVIPHAFG
jgi:DNA-binding CsgD family transcriptional regulator